MISAYQEDRQMAIAVIDSRLCDQPSNVCKICMREEIGGKLRVDAMNPCDERQMIE